MKRFLRASALAPLAGLALLAGCTGGTIAAPVPTALASSGPAGSSPAGGVPAAASPAATAPSSGSAAAVAAAALAALKAGRAVHIAISTTLSNGSVSYSDDATADGGRQYITLSTGGDVTVLYVGGVGYVQGNEQGLAGFMDVPLPRAQSLAGQWIAVHPGQELGGSSYADIVAGITLSSVASEIALAAPLALTAPATVAGQRAIVVQGRVPASQQPPASARVTLDVAAAGSRPLRETVVASGGYKSTTTFSDWGESVPLSAPPHPVAPAASPPALD